MVFQRSGTPLLNVLSPGNCPNWERLWDDFIQEETCDEALCSRQSKGEENEENVALLAKKKNMKAIGGEKLSHGEKRDMKKVRCFACPKLRYYAGQCLNN
jgi:hypothetical protein